VDCCALLSPQASGTSTKQTDFPNIRIVSPCGTSGVLCTDFICSSIVLLQYKATVGSVQSTKMSSRDVAECSVGDVSEATREPNT